MAFLSILFALPAAAQTVTSSYPLPGMDCRFIMDSSAATGGGFYECHGAGGGGESRPSAPPPRAWAAIALSNTTLWSGTGWNTKTRAEAERNALAECNGKMQRQGLRPDCAIMISRGDACIAMAVSTRKIVGLDEYHSPEQAERFALSRCRNSGGTDCKVWASPCSSDGPRPAAKPAR
jgi:hypothetical protein